MAYRESLGLNGSEVSVEVKKLTEGIKGMNESFKNFQDTMRQLLQEQANANAEQNAVLQFIQEERTKFDESRNSYEGLTGQMGDHAGGLAWRDQALNRINNDQSLTEEQRSSARDSINEMYQTRQDDKSKKDAQQSGKEIGDILQGTLEDIILDFDNFDKSIKNMANQLLNNLVHQFTSVIFNGLGNMISSSALSAAGPWGMIANFGLGLLGKHHSGGVIPNAGYELGGTGEQLAILKGGERVLSPGENVEYNRSENGGGSPVVFNNFNIKAWDSKDVQKYLLENKQLLNSITYQGIKDNNQHLRNIVKNA